MLTPNEFIKWLEGIRDSVQLTEDEPTKLLLNLIIEKANDITALPRSDVKGPLPPLSIEEINELLKKYNPQPYNQPNRMPESVMYGCINPSSITDLDNPLNTTT